MKRSLESVKPEELIGRTLKVIKVTARLCELCGSTLDTRQNVIRTIRINDRNDVENLLLRSKIYDRSEIDFDENKVYFHSHDYPGDVHPSCLEKQ